MFYVLSPTFSSATQRISFHASLHARVHAVTEKEKQTQENFPNSFMVHTHTQARRESATRTRELFLFVKHVSSTFPTVCPAISSRTENAHQRKFLMLLTIKGKCLVGLSILLLRGVKAQKKSESSDDAMMNYQFTTIVFQE